MPGSEGALDFNALVSAIRHVHDHLAAQVGKAVNMSLTLRNWAIGCYVRDYEQGGADRAQYGENLLENLASSLQDDLDKCYTGRYLRLCRQIYDVYPQIRKSLISRLGVPEWGNSPISRMPGPSANDNEPIAPTAAAPFDIPGDTLVRNLSFTMLAELIRIDDPLKRAFYEIECIRGNWSVRQLKRQIASLYFERSGLSRDKEKLAAMVKAGAETAEPRLAIRDPYVFEFLGLRGRDAAAESEVEAALIENLRDFLLELGHGFCLEAQQKSILIGKTRGFVDLVFYHRLLKCHVLVDLKVDEFRHECIGQLNTYVNWYHKNMMVDGDNPPVGLLLCTQKDNALVEYALAGMDNQLFVSKYQLELPGKDDIQRFLEEKIREVGGG